MPESLSRGTLGQRLFGHGPASGVEGNGTSRQRARVISIASGKGGVGKSIVATNLAVLRAQRGERVLLVDFDAGMANAHLLLGLAPAYDLAHVLEGKVSPFQAIVEGPEGVRLLSGGVGRTELVSPTRRELERLFRALRPLEEGVDRIVIDHGAGLSYSTLVHLAAASTLLLVTNHEVTALSDAYALFKRAHALNPMLRTGLVINRAPSAAQADSAWERFSSVCRRFLEAVPELVGVIPADDAVGESVEERVPVVIASRTSPAAIALSRIASWRALDQPPGRAPFYELAAQALR